MDKTTDAEYEGFIDGVDVTSESIPNAGGENVTNTLVEAKQNGNFCSWLNVVFILYNNIYVTMFFC